MYTLSGISTRLLDSYLCTMYMCSSSLGHVEVYGSSILLFFVCELHYALQLRTCYMNILFLLFLLY